MGVIIIEGGRNMRRGFLFLITCVSLVSLPLTAFAFQIEEGVIDEVRGPVTVVSFEGEARRGKAGDFVMSGEAIETGPGGFARVVMADGSVMEVFEKSRTEVIDSRVYQRSSHALALFMGRVWAGIVGDDEGETSFEVVTPTAVAGVRGTQFSTGVAVDGATRVGVDKGAVTVTTESGEISLEAGKETIVEWDGQAGPAKDYLGGEQSWRDWALEHQDKLVRHGDRIVPLIMKEARQSRRKMWRIKNRGDAIFKRLKNQAERQQRRGRAVKLTPAQQRQLANYIKSLLKALLELYVADQKMMAKYYILKQIHADTIENPDIYSPEFIEVVEEAVEEAEEIGIEQIHNQNRQVISAYLTALDEFAKKHKLGKYKAGAPVEDRKGDLSDALEKYREGRPR
jgi:hypothetical protein